MITIIHQTDELFACKMENPVWKKLCDHFTSRAGTSSGKVNVFFLFPRLGWVIYTLKHVCIKRVERPLRKTSHTDANLPPYFPHASISGRRPGGQFYTGRSRFIFSCSSLKARLVRLQIRDWAQRLQEFPADFGAGILAFVSVVGKADGVGKGEL